MTQNHSRHEQARELQLDALLHEAAGVLPNPSLGDRIAQAVHARGHVAPPRTGSPWLFAAAAVLGLGTVGAVAWLRQGERAALVVQAQDPQPAPTPQPAPVPAPAPVPQPQDPAKPPAPKQEPKADPQAAAKWTTWIADYSENQIVEVAADGTKLCSIDQVFGAWDIELVAADLLLVTEFSVSRVQLMDLHGKAKWSYEDLKNPYDADHLPNGNILIADTFGGRVLEVTPTGETGGKVVWSYGKDIRPFDADRLPNGTTLIADVLKDRVIEVDTKGEIVWSVGNLPNIHDADRLPNGNTLVTLRNSGTVRELDRDGKVVWKLEGLKSPSDADRLPNGNTLVAENTYVREFDPAGKVVWTKAMVWAVEANRYYEK